MRSHLTLFIMFGISANALADMNAAQQALDSQDYVTAIRLLEADAKRNNVEAGYLLGTMYRDGLGVKADPVMALQIFEDASDVDWIRDKGKFGSPDAQYQAGLMYRDGVGTERDLEEATDYFEQAAEQNHGPSQAMLAKMLLRGEGAGQDYQEAYIWASLAIQKFPEEEAKGVIAVRDEAAKHLSFSELASAKKKIRAFNE